LIDFVNDRAGVFILSFLGTLAMGPLLIPALKKLKFGQPVRDDGPSTHLKKAGTPTLGGIVFLAPTMAILCILSLEQRNVLPLLTLTIGFGAVGFSDDYLKIIKKSKNGLSAMQKTVGLLLVSTAFVLFLVYVRDAGTEMYLPLAGMMRAVEIPAMIYIPFTIFTMLATTNSVNLTDGVDGLAASVTLIVMIFFTLVAAANAEQREIMLYTAIIAGGCLGFLVFNFHPAKVFMGDCGALALGGAVAAAAIVLKIHWVLLFTGIIYVLEAISDIIQVFWYKTRGKRVFKMAPLHHHFELSGWKETKVVVVFCVVTLVFSVIGWLLLFLE